MLKNHIILVDQLLILQENMYDYTIIAVIVRRLRYV